MQQSQHTSFFVFGFHEQSLISQCHLNWVPGHARCNLIFDRGHNDTFHILFDYEDLKKIEVHLIKALKQLHGRMVREKPVTSWNKYIYLFRAADYQALEDLIAQIESESLSGRFLMTHAPRTVESISSKELVEEIFKVFNLMFLPYDIR